ncbi:hypothetical protein [Actinomadura opuntiae]|uniref:hypothetical protein n=1 Tax=Actinomadura sp. OS1-43 TaxID=604315 RepID=UPI00333E9486
MRASDDDLLIIPMIETVEAVENIEEICALDQVAILTFVAGEFASPWARAPPCAPSPRCVKRRKRCRGRAKAQRRLIGGLILDPSKGSCAAALDSGISVLCVGLDALRSVDSARPPWPPPSRTQGQPTPHPAPAPPSGFPVSY